MARYIDADKLLRKSFRIEGHFDLPSGKAQNFSAICDTEIINFPTADVAPVIHGHWEVFGGTITNVDRNGECSSETIYECSACRWDCQCENRITWAYCPNCGAKMDGDKNEM